MSDTDKQRGPPPIPQRRSSGIEVIIDTIAEENRRRALAAQAVRVRGDQRLRRILAVLLPSVCAAMACVSFGIWDDVFCASFSVYLTVLDACVTVLLMAYAGAYIMQHNVMHRIHAESVTRERSAELAAFGTTLRRASRVPYADA